jgi:hypothetical protein
MSSCWAPSSIPAKSISVLCWKKGDFTRVFSYSLGYPPSILFRNRSTSLLIFIYSLLLPEWQNWGSLVITKKKYPFVYREAMDRNVRSYFNYNPTFSFKKIRTKSLLTRPSVFNDKYWWLKNVWNFREIHFRFYVHVTVHRASKVKKEPTRCHKSWSLFTFINSTFNLQIVNTVSVPQQQVQNTICSYSLVLLKMGTMVPETCWVYESEWTSAFVTSCWFSLHFTCSFPS